MLLAVRKTKNMDASLMIIHPENGEKQLSLQKWLEYRTENQFEGIS